MGLGSNVHRTSLWKLACPGFCWVKMLCDHLPCNLGFSGGTSGKELACQCKRDKRRGFDPWVGKIPWRRRAWQPLQYSSPENHMGSEAWRATVPVITNIQIQLKWLSTQACMGILCFACWVIAKLLSTAVVSFYIPTSRGCNLSPTSSVLVIFNFYVIVLILIL